MVVGAVGKIHLVEVRGSMRGEHMEGNDRKKWKRGYDMEVSGGQVCGSGRWKGCGRCDRRRREMEWETDVSGR
jgi:hypothetical protein